MQARPAFPFQSRNGIPNDILCGNNARRPVASAGAIVRDAIHPQLVIAVLRAERDHFDEPRVARIYGDCACIVVRVVAGGIPAAADAAISTKDASPWQNRCPSLAELFLMPELGCLEKLYATIYIYNVCPPLQDPLSL